MAVPALRDRGAWLATTARRECLTSVRRAARCRPSDEVDVLADEEFAGADTRLLRHERDVACWNAFKRYPGVTRRCSECSRPTRRRATNRSRQHWELRSARSGPSEVGHSSACTGNSSPPKPQPSSRARLEREPECPPKARGRRRQPRSNSLASRSKPSPARVSTRRHARPTTPSHRRQHPRPGSCGRSGSEPPHSCDTPSPKPASGTARNQPQAFSDGAANVAPPRRP
jgi:hypothetical protein